MSSISSGSLLFPPKWNGAVPTMPVTIGSLGTPAVMDAAGEKIALMGRVYWAGGAAEKVVSSAGGKIYVNMSTLTCSSASTILGIGIQDIDATAASLRPDGVFDVSTTITGSSPGPISELSINTFTMTSGSKSITAGAFLAIVFDFSAFGVGDALRTRVFNSAANCSIPCLNNFTTAWNAVGYTGTPIAVIEADDGTLGWFDNSAPALASITSVSFSVGSTNDEFGLRFWVPFTAEVKQLEAYFSAALSTADASVILYSSPNTTPTTITAFAVDGSHRLAAGPTQHTFVFANPTTLTSSTTYLVSVAAIGTAANAVIIGEMHSSAHKETWVGGSGLAVGARADGAGAFSMVETHILLGFGVGIHAITTGASSAAGLLVNPGMQGGARG